MIVYVDFFARIGGFSKGFQMAGGLGRSGIEARDEQRVMGITQREYKFRVGLPRYMEKVELAVQKAKKPMNVPLF